MEKEKKYYDMDAIFDFLGFDDKFANKEDYPFNRPRENVTFSWGQIIIPKTGIHEVVQNKISDIKELPINEIKMLYQIPFIVDEVKWKEHETGIINQNISLTFRYDKEWKYGDINKSIYETCFYILENAIETNDFFIISDESIFPFFSYYVIDNQWGVGSLRISSPPNRKYTKSDVVKSDDSDGDDDICHYICGEV